MTNQTKALKDLKDNLTREFEKEKINLSKDHEEQLAKLRLEHEKTKMQVVDLQASKIHEELALNILKMTSLDRWEPSTLIRDHETWLKSLR